MDKNGIMRQGNGRTRIKRVISSFLYVLAIGFPFLPSFFIDGEYNTIYQAYLHIKDFGVGGISGEELLQWSGGTTALKIGVIVICLYQAAGLLYILSLWVKKNWHLNIIALLLSLCYLFVCSDAVSVAADTGGFISLGIPALICAAELLFTKMAGVWGEAVKSADENARREQARKEEEKRRLYLPGKYPKQFYHMIWGIFQYDWKDYSLLLLCSIMISMFTFAGVGCYQMLAGQHREENFLIGQGVGLILWNAMIPMGICAVFLMVFVLIFYLQKWMESYSIFITLGIRRKTLYIILAAEVILCFLFSVLCGIAAGNILVVFLRKALCRMLGGEAALAGITGKTYYLMFAVMISLYVISLMASRDILQDFNLIHASNRRIRREKIPGKRSRILIAAGVILITGSAALYTQLVRHESVYLLAGCFAGVFLLVRYGGAVYLRKEKRKKTYLKHLMGRNQLYHKSKTTAWYLTALIVLYTYAMFCCTFQYTSAVIAEEPETLFPYDFVCIADDGDKAFFDSLEEKYEAKIISCPMVRVSNADKSEKAESYGQRRPQGQQIGISETTYHQLKQMREKNEQSKALGLDKNGESVYLVHQQDRSVKAQPVDWTYGTSKPFLHIGLPCTSYVPESPSEAFAQREIAGEEIGSLIGCFRQGNLENIVVFSDEYFEKAQDMWKYTNIYTGDPIENEAERMEGMTIYQGPTQLILLNADEKYLADLEKVMETWKEQHTYEARFDSEVSCYYSGKTAVADMETERIMKRVANAFLLVIMMMAGMFLLYVKSASEVEAKKRRAEFLKCMGMRRKERVHLLRKELNLFYFLPVLITAVIAMSFTFAAFHARMYPLDIVVSFLKKAVWLWGGCILAQGMFIWILGLWYIRKVEGRDE